MADLDKEGLTGRLVDVVDKPHMGIREITKDTIRCGYKEFYTTEEYEARRKRVLSTPLPGYK